MPSDFIRGWMPARGGKTHQSNIYQAVSRVLVLIRTAKALVHLFQPLGVEAEFLGHLVQLLRSFGILDGLGELPGSIGLLSIVVGLGHRSTFLDEYGLRQKGSSDGSLTVSYEGGRAEKRAPCSFQENKRSLNVQQRGRCRMASLHLGMRRSVKGSQAPLVSLQQMRREHATPRRLESDDDPVQDDPVRLKSKSRCAYRASR
jgi:hypothetical protein